MGSFSPPLSERRTRRSLRTRAFQRRLMRPLVPHRVGLPSCAPFSHYQGFSVSDPVALTTPAEAKTFLAQPDVFSSFLLCKALCCVGPGGFPCGFLGESSFFVFAPEPSNRLPRIIRAGFSFSCFSTFLLCVVLLKRRLLLLIPFSAVFSPLRLMCCLFSFLTPFPVLFGCRPFCARVPKVLFPVFSVLFYIPFFDGSSERKHRFTVFCYG